MCPSPSHRKRAVCPSRQLAVVVMLCIRRLLRPAQFLAGRIGFECSPGQEKQEVMSRESEACGEGWL